MGKPIPRNIKERLYQCPNCGIVAQLDEDQFRGRVSIDCPDCPYHETHDLSEDEKGPHRTAFERGQEVVKKEIEEADRSCPLCDGEGSVPLDTEGKEVEKCNLCEGTGRVSQ